MLGITAFLTLSSSLNVESFAITSGIFLQNRHEIIRQCNSCITILQASGSPTEQSEVREDPSKMRLGEIQAELKKMNVSYKDCFDKESLINRLIDARKDQIEGSGDDINIDHDGNDDSEPSPESPTAESASTKTPPGNKFDKELVLEKLRSLRVKELRAECAKSNIRWGNMIEKEDLVQALLLHKEKAAFFSPSGVIIPGQVAEIDGDTLGIEVAPGAATTPLLLDVYATWCGPCQLMAPQLVEAAKELGETGSIANCEE